jgi:molybdate transport system substrate-binding protein
VSRWVTLMVCAAGVLLVGAGCGSELAQEAGGETATEGGQVYALVPCGQVGPFSEAVELFTKAHPEVKIDWEPENIVTMVNKVLDGKSKPDVFLSMGDLEMDQIEAAGLVVEGTRARIAENALALTVPADNPAGVRSFEDLVKPAVKTIAVPNPEENSVGKHAKEAIERAGMWDAVEKKLIFPRFAADGKQVAAQGKVDASIGYRPCVVEVHVPGQAPAQPKGLKMVAAVPLDLYDEFWCEAAVIQGARNPEGGRMVIEFLGTPGVQEIYRKWSFTRSGAQVGQ